MVIPQQTEAAMTRTLQDGTTLDSAIKTHGTTKAKKAFNSNLPPAPYNQRNKATHKSKMAENGNPMIPPQMIELIKFLNRYVSN